MGLALLDFTITTSRSRSSRSLAANLHAIHSATATHRGSMTDAAEPDGWSAPAPPAARARDAKPAGPAPPVTGVARGISQERVWSSIRRRRRVRRPEVVEASQNFRCITKPCVGAPRPEKTERTLTWRTALVVQRTRAALLRHRSAPPRRRPSRQWTPWCESLTRCSTPLAHARSRSHGARAIPPVFGARGRDLPRRIARESARVPRDAANSRPRVVHLPPPARASARAVRHARDHDYGGRGARGRGRRDREA